MTSQARDAASEIVWTSPSFWGMCRDLLLLWRSADQTSPHAEANERWHRWARVVEIVSEHFDEGRDDDGIDGDDRSLLDGLLASSAADWDTLHGIAWGLSIATSETFAPAWRDEFGREPRPLAAGEPFPVADAPWEPRDGLELTSRPASMTSPVNELPTVRIHDGSFEAWIDFRPERSLEAIATRLSCLAAVHPNRDWSELRVEESDGAIFPVAPRHEANQADIVERLVLDATEGDAALIVLPELSVTESIVERLGVALRGISHAHLVVAGSQHVLIDGAPENQAVGLISGSRRRLVQCKNVPFSDELRRSHPRKEGIRQRAPVRLTVYPADRFRFAIAICRDLLDNRVRAAYDRLGVNVLAVPALSDKVAPFCDAVRARVSAAQAMTFVVNGPLHDSNGERHPYDVVLGQPIANVDQGVFSAAEPGPTFVQTHLEF